MVKFTVLPLTLICATLILPLAGCDDPKETITLPIRPIKSMIVKARPSLQLRHLSGVVTAETSTALSFELSGNITKLSVKTGDLLNRGDIIAELDAEPYQLKIATAKSEVFSANAGLENAKEKFKQQNILLNKGFTTKTNYDTALANLKSAKANLSVAQTRLDVTDRDLKKTKLTAPFRGRIAKKSVEIFNEVTPGQQVVEFITDEKLNIDVAIPEGMIEKIKIDDVVQVSFPTKEKLETSGKIRDIGTSAGAINSFPVTITLDKQFPELKPGLSAEVVFKIRNNIKNDIFLLPITAILPHSKKKVLAYIFDPDTELLQKRVLDVLNVHDNSLEVRGNIKTGEIIASAGVSFLRDNMKVRLLVPQPKLPGDDKLTSANAP